MTSATSTISTSPDVQRLNLKPDAPVTGFVDGAWWPASRDLAAELPRIEAELVTRLGRVETVSYNIGAWDAAPRKARIGSEIVRMAGYHSQAHDTIDVQGGRRRLTLLIVPPETDSSTAQEALAAAGRAGNVDDVGALLAGAEPRARTSEQ